MVTIKQKKAFKAAMENGGNITQAMRAAGYRKSTTNNPDILTRSDGWAELVEEHLPDSALAKRHREVLDGPDVTGVTKALDMAYKLKGAYAPERSIVANVEVNTQAKEKAREAIRGLLDS